MKQRPAPPLAVELSRDVLTACRRDPALTQPLNTIFLRATRRLRALMETGGSLLVRGRAEGITLQVTLLPPDGCRVERILSPSDDQPAAIVV
ncbi:MAG: hypothetical protein ACRDJE_28190 [Dehalococcoidia bacterium]